MAQQAYSYAQRGGSMNRRTASMNPGQTASMNPRRTANVNTTRTASANPAQTYASDDQQGGFFKDISFAQIFATTLAAVTSMLLSSQIGITGSVIGVAAGAAVSTLCTQVYKGFLSRSADKIRGRHSDDDCADVEYAQGMTQTARGAHSRTYGQTPRLGDDAVVSTRAMNARTQKVRKAKVQRGVIIVSIVSALAAVAVCAGVINLTTAGQGVGTKTDPIIAADTSATPTKPTDASAGNGAAAQSSSTDTTSSSTSSSSDESSTKSSTSTSSTTGTTTDTGTSTTGTGSTSGTTGTSTTGTTGSGSASGTGTTTDSGTTGTTTGTATTDTGSTTATGTSASAAA